MCIIFQIRTCASLLHVTRSEINDVLDKVVESLKVNGIFFASFKYGDGEVLREERLFNSYNENSLKKLIAELEHLEIVEIWTTQDVRPGRDNEKWVSCLCKKY